MSEIRLSDQLEQMAIEDVEEGAKAAIEAMKKSLNSSYEHMIRVGHFLNAMKAKLPHGSWGQWLKDNFDDSHQWAARLMACAADRANLKSTLNLSTVTTIEQHYALLMNTPEKQAKRAEREAKKLETAPKSPAPATPALQPQRPVTETITEASTYHSVAAQVAKPAWLADPDELERPEETDLPPLPKTNTHHTTANRREPDARETDRAGIVPPQDPRTLEDGAWYEWSEDRGRLVLVTDEDILAEADKIDQRRHDGRQPETVAPAKKSTDTKPGKVPTAKALCSFTEERADIGTNRHLWTEQMVKGVQEWALYKQSLTGKAKVRSLEQWAKALTRIENVVAAQGWPAVADMLEKAIANGWQGWEHQTDSGRKPAPVAPHRTYTRLNKAEVKYDELPE